MSKWHTLAAVVLRHAVPPLLAAGLALAATVGLLEQQQADAVRDALRLCVSSSNSPALLARPD